MINNFKTPHQGDIVWLNIEESSGREAGSHDKTHHFRPVLVLSRSTTNASGMIECMPMSSHNHMPKPYSSFMIKSHADYGTIHGHRIRGYVFTFQLSCYDMPSRDGEIIGHMNDKVTNQCLYYGRELIAKE